MFIVLSAACLSSQSTTPGLRRRTTIMTDRQYHKRLSAIDVWKTRMPIRTTNMHSLKGFKELQKLKFEWQAAGHVSSEYEQNVGKLLAKKKERLEELMKNPRSEERRVG